MTKQRLSCLQSRICYAFEHYQTKNLARHSLALELYANSRSRTASLSRSLKNLEKKGIIELSHKNNKIVNIKLIISENPKSDKPIISS